MLGSCLCQSEKKLRWKRLWTPSCSLQLLGPWIQEPIHSRRRREGAHWQNEFTFVKQYKTNSSFKEQRLWEKNYHLQVISSIFHTYILTLQFNNFINGHNLASELEELGSGLCSPGPSETTDLKIYDSIQISELSFFVLSPGVIIFVSSPVYFGLLRLTMQTRGHAYRRS